MTKLTLLNDLSEQLTSADLTAADLEAMVVDTAYDFMPALLLARLAKAPPNIEATLCSLGDMESHATPLNLAEDLAEFTGLEKARPETLRLDFVTAAPVTNCWKCLAVKVGRKYKIVLDKRPASTIAPIDREAWPTCYIGGEALSEQSSGIGGAEPIETKKTAEYALRHINAEITALERRDGGCSEWELENYLNASFAKYSFWSTRLGPTFVEGRQKKAIGQTKAKNRRVAKHQTANKVARAETSEHAETLLTEEHEHHTESRVVGKPEQALAAESRGATSEHNSVKQTGEMVPTHPKQGTVTITDEGRKQAAEEKAAELVKQTKRSKPIDVNTVKEIGTLPIRDANKLAHWVRAKHGCTLQTLETGDKTNSGESVVVVYRRTIMGASIARSITSKAVGMIRRAAKIEAESIAYTEKRRRAEVKTASTVTAEAETSLKAIRCKAKQGNDKTTRDAAFARSKRQADEKAKRKPAEKKPSAKPAIVETFTYGGNKFTVKLSRDSLYIFRADEADGYIKWELVADFLYPPVDPCFTDLLVEAVMKLEPKTGVMLETKKAE